MSAGAFLLMAVGLSIVGSLLIWVLNRKPKTFMSSIDDFSREMKALGREPEVPATGRRRKRTVNPPGGSPAAADARPSATAIQAHDQPAIDPNEERSP
jgi:hypothetical protein